MLTGLRGVGKTVLLNEIDRLAIKTGYRTVSVEAHEDKSLAALLGAGLPILPGLAGESKSYAERLFSFPDIGALSEHDAIKALQDPTKAVGVDFELAALKEIFRLTPGEKRFLRAMAGLRSGAQRSGDIAEALKVTNNGLGPLRSKLIKKGMVYSPAHGGMAFTVPLFDEFMLRAMPNLD